MSNAPTPGAAVARWPDGCPKAGHIRDAICALGKVDLPPADEPEPEGDRGGST